MTAEHPALDWSDDLRQHTGLSAVDCVLANAVDLETYRYVRERVDAVSDSEWELLCSFEAGCVDEWTHGIFLEEAVEHTEDIPSNAIFNPNAGGQSTCMCPIFYGTPESLGVYKGKVFPKQQVTAILRVLDYGLIDNLLTPETPCECLQATT